MYNSTVGAVVGLVKSLGQVPYHVGLVYFAFNGVVFFLACSC